MEWTNDMSHESDVLEYVEMLVAKGKSVALATIMAEGALKAETGAEAKLERQAEREADAAATAQRCADETAAMETWLADSMLDFEQRINAVLDAKPEFVKGLRIDVGINDAGDFAVLNQTVSAKSGSKGSGRGGISPSRVPTASEKALMRVSMVRLVRHNDLLGLDTVSFGDRQSIAGFGKGLQYFRVGADGTYLIHRTGPADGDGFKNPPSVFTSVYRFLLKQAGIDPTNAETLRPWSVASATVGTTEADAARLLGDWLDQNGIPAAEAGDGVVVKVK
jgi:hypothetical protein